MLSPRHGTFNDFNESIGRFNTLDKSLSTGGWTKGEAYTFILMEFEKLLKMLLFKRAVCEN